jgi:alkylation response protein AidB-like acyl-CoA dehydrogenase
MTMTPPDKPIVPADAGTDEDLSAFAVFDPEAGEALIRKRVNAPEPDQSAALEFPPLMGEQTLTRAVAERWQALREAERQRDRPDPWPIIERSFPRIAAHIREHWGKRALDDYFGKLVIDERGGRQGFPMEVLAAIMEIARLHAQQFGLDKPVRPWEADVSETKWWYKR